MPGATRDELWLAAAADLLNGAIAVPALDLTIYDTKPSMPDVELVPFCDIIFADTTGLVWPGLDLFEGGAAH